MPKTKLTYHTQHGDGDGDDNGILGIHLIRVVARAYFTYTYTYTHTDTLSSHLSWKCRREELATCEAATARDICVMCGVAIVACRCRCRCRCRLLSCLRLRLAAVRQIARLTILRVCRRACVCVGVSVCWRCVRQLLLFFKFIGSQVSREVRINGNVLPKPAAAAVLLCKQRKL